MICGHTQKTVACHRSIPLTGKVDICLRCLPGLLYISKLRLPLSCFFSFKIDFYLCVCECLSHVCKCPLKSEEAAGCPGAGVTGSCELPHINSGNWTGFSITPGSTLNC